MALKKEHHDEFIAAGFIAAYAAGMLMMAVFYNMNDGSWAHKTKPPTPQVKGATCPDRSSGLEEQALQIANGKCN
jgi:hypothetical protein